MLQVARLPRVRLAALPTPLHEAPRLERALAGEGEGPRLLIKRDDLTGFALGGNKVRKIEYHLGEALAGGFDTLVTTGAIQSNHCRVTAAAARVGGMDCVLALRPVEPEMMQGNFLLDHLFGARIRITPGTDRASAEAVIEEEMAALRTKGRRPYFIPSGASTPLGAAAYAQAFVEMLGQTTAQGIAVDSVVFCSGSGGTHAGLAIGAALSQSGVEIVGIGDGARREDLAPKVSGLVAEFAERFDVDVHVAPNDVIVLDEYGGTYGEPTAEGTKAIKTAARSEGILLDPVYTGKAMAGLADLIRRRRWSRDQTVVFWHTGGQPALFSSAEALMAGDSAG
ncbi:MAG TPA: D-cysteine desulfhydrase family protein [bacterium]|nr:D-cysteine desulfhydrase family protein [bacterium]